MTSEWIPPPGREAGFYDIRLTLVLSTFQQQIKNHTLPNLLVKHKVLLKIYMHLFFPCILFFPSYVLKKKPHFF